MKQSVSPAVIIGVLVVIVLVVGVAAYRTFFKNPYASPLSGSSMKAYDDAKARSAIHQSMQNSGGGRGMHSHQ